MEQVKKDIEMFLKFANKEEGNEPKFCEYSSVFIFGTENQSAINSIIDYKDKDVLTVASSADQYISALYYGAKKCEIFDINRFTYYMSYLKLAAIKCLDYDEFMRFMIPYNNGEQNKYFWSLETLKKIAPLLPNDVVYFFEHVFYTYRKQGLGNFTHLTDKSVRMESIITGMPFYADKKEYYRLQEMLNDLSYPKFYLGDLLELGSLVKDSYDILYFSNIIECLVYEKIAMYPYYYHVNEDDIELDIVNEVWKNNMQLLRTGGTVLMSYRPNTNLDNSYDVLYHNDFFEPTLVPSKIEADTSNYQRGEQTDIVLTYSPSKKGNFLG